MHTKFSMQPGDGERSKRPKGKGWVPGIGDHPHPHAKEGVTDQEPGVLDDAQLLGPLAQPLLAPQEGTDAGVSHQLDAGFRRGPLVGGRLALTALLLVVGLVGAAHGLSILCKKTPGSRPCQVGDVPKEALLLPEGGRAAGRSSRWSPGHPRSPHP